MPLGSRNAGTENGGIVQKHDTSDDDSDKEAHNWRTRVQLLSGWTLGRIPVIMTVKAIPYS